MSKTTVLLTASVVLFVATLLLTAGIQDLQRVLDRDVALPRLVMAGGWMLAGAVLLIPTLGRHGYRQACRNLIDGLVGRSALTLLSPRAWELYLRMFIMVAGLDLAWSGLVLIR